MPKPVSMRLEHVFLSYDGGLLRFLVFPLVVDNWLFQGGAEAVLRIYWIVSV